MANNIDIVVRTIDKTGGIFAGIAGSIASSITAIVAFTKKAIDANEEYVTSVVDLSRVLGTSTEETSKLVQATGSLFISQKNLNTAMMAASKQGIDTSIAGLQKLSKEYLALDAGVERTQFLIKKFGSSAGPEMGKLLELGEDGMKGLMDATSKSLIVTKQSEYVTYEYKRSVDALKGSMDGLEYSVAQGSMPALTKFNIEMADFIESANESEVVTKAFTGALHIASSALMFWDGILAGDITKWFYAKEGAKDYKKALEDLPAALGAVASADLGLVSSFTTSENEYLTNAETNNAELLTLMEERARLRKLGYSNESKAIRDIDAALDENAQRADDNAAAHEEATRRIIFGYIQQQLAVDGLSAEETEFLLAKGVEWGIYSETAIEMMQAVQTEWNNFVPGNKTATFTIITQKQIQEGAAVDYSNGYYNSVGEWVSTKAVGGYVAGGNSYLVGERGPEIFTPSGGGQITPNGQLGGGGGMSESQMTRFAQILGVVVATEVNKMAG